MDQAKIKSESIVLSNQNALKMLFLFMMEILMMRFSPKNWKPILSILKKNSLIVSVTDFASEYCLQQSSADTHVGNAINSLRRLLRRTWATANNFICIQPLEQILYYFGAKTTIYFAWLGFYTQMLIPPAIFGVLVFLRGFFGFGGIGLIDDPVKGSKSRQIFSLGKNSLTW